MSITEILKPISKPDLEKWKIEASLFCDSIAPSPTTIIESIQNQIEERSK
jgi:hypothetical protein